MTRLTLPTDSAERKNVPLYSGCFKYFPAALAGVARHAKEGNDKHNPGEPLHHDRGKSRDHSDCILRHLMDLADLFAAFRRTGGDADREQILQEADALAWRALALSQWVHETVGSAPLAPGARLPEPERIKAAQPDSAWVDNTGSQPVPDDEVVEYRTLENGSEVHRCHAGHLQWDRLGCATDIVEWRQTE